MGDTSTAPATLLALREGEAFLRDALDSLQDGFLALDREWRITYVNHATAAAAGRNPAELIGRNIWESFPGLDATEHGAAYRRAMAERVSIGLEVKGLRADRWFRIGISPTAHGLFIVWSDATDRKLAEEALRRSEDRLRLLVQHTPAAVAMFDREMRYLAVSRRFASDYRLPGSGLLGRSHYEVFPEIPERWRAIHRRCLAGASERCDEDPFPRPDGTVDWVRWEILPWRDARDEIGGLILFSENITERKRAAEAQRRAEEALRRSEAMLAAVLDQMPSGVTVRDARTGELLLSNRRSRALLGDLVSTPSQFVRYRGVHPDGRPYLDREWPVTRSIATGEVVEAEEVTIERPDGTRVTLAVSSSPVRDGEGNVVMGVAVFHDITDRKRAEEALRQADRRKDEFLAVLSHELRNPLAPIRNSIYLLERVPPQSEQAARAREILRRQTDHVARLVDDLLDVTRISRGKITLQRDRFDLRDVVRKTADDVRSLFEQARIELRMEHAAGPIWVNADSVRISQVLANLLHNAVKFTPAGGTVRVAVGARQGQAEVSVHDTGVGIEPGEVERMFEPFAQADQGPARTKGGLGLGLALARGILDLHGGTIRAHSAGLDRGAEFVVALPLAAAEGSPAGERGPAPAGAAREILVIEDNFDAGQTLAEILGLLGHRVRFAADARSGLALARERRPDVIVCDIGLPDVDGYQVAREIRRDPALAGTRLVALTGYAQPEDRLRAAEAGFDAFVPKPPAPGDLERAIGHGEGAAT